MDRAGWTQPGHKCPPGDDGHWCLLDTSPGVQPADRAVMPVTRSASRAQLGAGSARPRSDLAHPGAGGAHRTTTKCTRLNLQLGGRPAPPDRRSRTPPTRLAQGARAPGSPVAREGPTARGTYSPGVRIPKVGAPSNPGMVPLGPLPAGPDTADPWDSARAPWSNRRRACLNRSPTGPPRGSTATTQERRSAGGWTPVPPCRRTPLPAPEGHAGKRTPPARVRGTPGVF